MDYLEGIYYVLSDNQIQIWTLALTALTTLLWGVYVFFTIKTFNQIKKQTDLQSRAFLLVTPRLNNDSSDNSIDNKAVKIKEKWHGILENNLTTALSVNRIFEIELTNRGKSDIVSWSIDISLTINEGEYLKTKFGIAGETSKLKIISKSDQTIAPDQSIKVPIIQVGDFPNILFNWNITYKDLMEGEYHSICNNEGFANSNLIALNYKE